MPEIAAERPSEQQACDWLLILFPIALLTSLALSEILSVLSLVFVCYITTRTDNKRLLLRVTPSFWYPIVAAVAFSIFCMAPLTAQGILSSAFLDELRSLRWLLFWVVLSLVFGQTGRTSHNVMLRILSVSICLLSIYGCIQFWFGIDFSGREEGLHTSGERFRASGTFSLPQSYSGVLGILTFLLLPLGISRLESGGEVSHPKSVLPIIAVALGLIGVFCSGTRGAYLGMVLTFVLALFMLVLHRELSVRNAFWLFCVSLGGTIAIVSQLDTGFLEKVTFSGDEPDQSLIIRLPLWEAYLEMVAEQPWTGYGAGISSSYLPTYYEQIGAADAKFIGHSHNNYLQAWVDGGLGAFVAYLVLILSMLRITFRRIAQAANRQYVLLFIGLFLAQVYFHLVGITESNFIDVKVNHALIFIWALILGSEAWISEDNKVILGH